METVLDLVIFWVILTSSWDFVQAIKKKSKYKPPRVSKGRYTPVIRQAILNFNIAVWAQHWISTLPFLLNVEKICQHCSDRFFFVLWGSCNMPCLIASPQLRLVPASVQGKWACFVSQVRWKERGGRGKRELQFLTLPQKAQMSGITFHYSIGPDLFVDYFFRQISQIFNSLFDII